MLTYKYNVELEYNEETLLSTEKEIDDLSEAEELFNSIFPIGGAELRLVRLVYNHDGGYLREELYKVKDCYGNVKTYDDEVDEQLSALSKNF